MTSLNLYYQPVEGINPFVGKFYNAGLSEGLNENEQFGREFTMIRPTPKDLLSQTYINVVQPGRPYAGGPNPLGGTLQGAGFAPGVYNTSIHKKPEVLQQIDYSLDYNYRYFNPYAAPLAPVPADFSNHTFFSESGCNDASCRMVKCKGHRDTQGAAPCWAEDITGQPLRLDQKTKPPKPMWSVGHYF
jgi:hypothetical protein